MIPDRLRLMVLTDRSAAGGRAVEWVVERALAAGAPAVQLRDKSASARTLMESARRLRALTAEYGALFLVNDRLDVALASGADGAHLGPEDLPLPAARALAPEGFVLGYSTDDPDRARAAASEGASYIGCGTIFPTHSKADAGAAVGPDRVRAVARAAGIPVVAIGGIDTHNVAALAGCGAAGIAVLGAVMSAPDPGAATRALLEGAAALATCDVS
ncbi:MAG: thiamine phosphate synthase [Gemmatimonadota bacterium]|nr:thiamine phosphate synthase [Gemmatimonadota bacterium]